MTTSHRLWNALGTLLCSTLLGCGQTTEPQPDSPPQRIVSTTLATDEMLLELVAPERIVAISSFADDEDVSHVAGRYPTKIPRIPCNLEPIMARQPDLICVASYSSADTLELLRNAELPVWRKPDVLSFADIERALHGLGERCHAQDAAARVVQRMHNRLAAIETALAKTTRRPRVLYWDGSMTAGRDTMVGCVLERAGARNVAAELGITGHTQLPSETALTSQPEYLLRSRWRNYSPAKGTDLPPAIAHLEAVEQG
jgi:iron complex transport system substrate-binding protein